MNKLSTIVHSLVSFAASAQRRIVAARWHGDHPSGLRPSFLASVLLVTAMAGYSAADQEIPGVTDMTLDNQPAVYDWLADIEEAHGVGPDGTAAVCPETGKVYRTVCWGKEEGPLKSEGHEAMTFSTPEEGRSIV